ncbi:platelet-activating factor acetyltransferase [Fragilaria crotonensis]|nr:platelet-activating factor acetyltransferase [Fragilaria crotonensis]
MSLSRYLLLSERWTWCDCRQFKTIVDFGPEHDERVNCFGSLWRMIASVGLALLLILPFLYSFYQHVHRTHFNIPDYPSDKLQCAHDYNISFAQLHRQIEHATEFCGNEDHRMCSCRTPLEPIARVPGTPQYFQKWDQAHQRNRNVAAQATSARVVLYGDSIVEHLGGTDLGVASQETMSVKKQFDAVFDGQAVVLGLAGDRCPQLLYRLRYGELPTSLHPLVIWLLIGTNDQADNCSKESILIGIINIANFLQEQRPGVRLVINGILPKPNPVSREWKDTKFYASVTWINERLACYAEGQEGVEYFDPAFLFQDENGRVPKDLLPDGIHPSAKGARIWAEAILLRSESIIQEL